MKKSILITLILTFFLMTGLGFLSYWRFKNFEKSLSEVTFPEFKTPKFNPQAFLENQEQGNKEFVTPDGDLKINYPANWTEMKKDMLEYFNQNAVELEEAETLFFAYQYAIETTALPFLIVQKLNLEKNVEKIIEKVKESIEEGEGEIEIIKPEIEKDGGEFEAKYKKGGGYNFHSKEKIIFTEQNSYLIAVFSPEKDWPETAKKADEIFNSIQIVQ